MGDWFFSPWFVLTFLIPGFDERFDWSVVPPLVVMAADLVVMLGYGICFLATWQNQFASRTVQVEQEQKVISTGLYALVRHPMYLGILLMCLSLPLALGSYWAMIPAVLIAPVLMARIRSEESILERGLDDYRAYMGKTRYRLLPGVW